MKTSKSSKKTISKVSIITIVLLVIAIMAILFFTNNVDQNSEGEQKELEQKEIVQEENSKENPPQPEEPNNDDEVNSGATTTEDEEEPKDENDETNEQPTSVPNDSKNPTEDNGYIVDQTLPEEPTYVNGVLIANKKYPLPKSFNPGENVEARGAYEEMAAAARLDGYELTAFSTFRSFDYQTTLYNRYVERDGKDNADRYSARPGYSEHQTGLAFDIGEVGKENLWLTSEFGETEAGKWLVENAHHYGFILRYPEGKEHITGYMYESWHFRYIGTPIATEVKESGLTLEEYLNIH